MKKFNVEIDTEKTNKLNMQENWNMAVEGIEDFKFLNGTSLVCATVPCSIL